MSDRKEDHLRIPADELREGDGVDPREEKKARQSKLRRGKPDYAMLRLAGQIEKTLNLAITQAGDPALAGLAVSAVEPSASGTTFTVQAYFKNPEFDYDPQHVRDLLNAMRPGLRAEVAQAVNRKHAPDFTFDVLPPHVQPR